MVARRIRTRERYHRGPPPSQGEPGAGVHELAQVPRLQLDAAARLALPQRHRARQHRHHREERDEE
jgi:hypothetical protein